MLVKFKKSHPLYSYFVGNEADIKDPEELIKGGYVEPVEGEKEVKKEEKEAEPAKEMPKPETAELKPNKVFKRRK